jgi:hypothetical protein
MTSKAEIKVRKSVREYLAVHHPTEELRAAFMGMEGVSMLAELALLGPIASAAGRQNYHVGLTDKRIVFIPLSFWNGKPSGRVTETHLARVKKIEYKKGMMSSRLNIYYGQDLKRSMMLSLPFKKSGEEFESAFSLTSPPTITEKEMALAEQHESLYDQDKRDRVNNAILAFVLVIIFLVVINLIF